MRFKNLFPLLFHCRLRNIVQLINRNRRNKIPPCLFLIGNSNVNHLVNLLNKNKRKTTKLDLKPDILIFICLTITRRKNNIVSLLTSENVFQLTLHLLLLELKESIATRPVFLPHPGRSIKIDLISFPFWQVFLAFFQKIGP
jgi:hypothetical protein